MGAGVSGFGVGLLVAMSSIGAGVTGDEVAAA